MSAVQPISHVVRPKERNHPSADSNVSKIILTTPVPPPRQIPLPEFYPRERTSTASFKAPITVPKKKIEPPQPPPGTLTTAMNYISSPVRYISSIFTTTAPPPAPEPVKGKERHFKIDLERERDRQSSPKVSASSKKIQNVVAEDAIPPPKPIPQPEKNQVSAWRRKNMMEIAPLSPTPQKFRAQSPKRLTPSAVPNLDLTPTNISQMTIASSSAQHSYKVVSKTLVEEPEKKKKKDVKKNTNTRPSKEPPVFTNFNKSNPRYNPPLPSRLNVAVPSPKDENPIILFPTILPPRVPPPTYTIKSIQTPTTEEKVPTPEQEPSGESEPESAGAIALTAATPSDQPELVCCEVPPKLQPFNAGGVKDSSSVDDDEEPTLEETLGKVDIGDVFKVSRLDQLPYNRLKGIHDGNFQRLFHDATLINKVIDDETNTVYPGAAHVGATNLILCASSMKYESSPTRNFVKMADKNKTSTRKSPSIKKSLSSPKQLYSPGRKRPSPNLLQTDVKQPDTARDAFIKSQPPKIAAALDPPPKDTWTKNQPYSFTPQPSDILKKVPHSIEGRTNQNKEIALKTYHTRKTPSPNLKQPQKKVTPLKVEDKHVAAVEEVLGRNLNSKRPRSPNRFMGKDASMQQQQRARITSPPNIVKKTKPTKTKDPSPEKSMSGSVMSAAAVAAATAAAAAAATSIMQRHQDQDKSATASSLRQSEQEKVSEKEPRRSPFWKADTEGAVVSEATSPKFNSHDSELQQAGDSTATSHGMQSPASAAKSVYSEKSFLPKEKKTESTGSAQETGYNQARANTGFIEEVEEYNCLENYCGDPTKYFKAATMMGEIP